MRNYPTDKYDRDELKRLNCAPWMVELLKLNPSYCCWGPHEDYMWKEKEGWDSRCIVPNWQAHSFQLDDLNEVVNFYFSLNRESKECPTCGGSGYHPDAQWISESFYGHSTPFRGQSHGELMAIATLAQFGGGGHTAVVCGFPSDETLAKYGPKFRQFCEEMRDGDGEWNDKITDDEFKALKKSNRTWKWKSAEEANSKQRGGGLDGGHDAINRSILIEQRCKRLGVPRSCHRCDGHGHIFVEPQGHCSLTLWVLHPRKGCSRGVEITRIQQSDLTDVFAYLRQAAERNAERFARIPIATPA